MITIRKIYFLSLVVHLLNINAADAQHPVTVIQPQMCIQQPGTVTIAGFPAGAAFSLVYNKDSIAQPAIFPVADAAGNILIAGLQEGLYTNISITGTMPVAAPVNIPNSITLTDACIAKQSIKFVAAAYANFIGVEADDPSGFAQFNARLTLPLYRVAGIENNSSRQRFIPLRNLFFQLTYGNTDKFKLYAFDSLQSRYLNRLDLLAHNSFNANLSVNALTIIIPRNWHPLSGDLLHLYLDGFTSLLVTKVYDTLSKSSDATNKEYNVKSAVYGGNFKLSAKEGRWRVELAFRRFWIYPLSNSFNTTMNPQRENLADTSLPINKNKTFAGSQKKITGYNNIEALFVYRTGAKLDDDDSDIFLRYSFTSNLPAINSLRYSNSYFQFQLGYRKDITSLFSKSK